MESEKRINWLSLFIKIVIVFIFILIIIWLISKIIGNTKLSETFIKNINNMEKVSVEYFKTIDLPQKKGKSIKITLGELIEKELIVSDKEGANGTCDVEKSYSQIIREKDKYVVKTFLKCGKEKDTIKTNFSLKNCKNCNQTNEESNSSNKEYATSNNNSNEITQYEYVKETTSYSKWMRGSLTGENIENKYEYYGIANDTYYTLGVIPSNQNSITYTLKLDKVPNEKYYFTIIEETTNYIEEDKDNYTKEKDVSIYKGSKTNIPKDISKYSLGETNFTYKLSPYYRKESFYIRVTININNTDGVNTYYDNKLKESAYLIPLKINVKFASNIISEKKPEGNYETISYYRYVTTEKETIWSTESSMDGYTKTGNTKIK